MFSNKSSNSWLNGGEMLTLVFRMIDDVFVKLIIWMFWGGNAGYKYHLVRMLMFQSYFLASNLQFGRSAHFFWMIELLIIGNMPTLFIGCSRCFFLWIKVQALAFMTALFFWIHATISSKILERSLWASILEKFFKFIIEQLKNVGKQVLWNENEIMKFVIVLQMWFHPFPF